MALVLVGAIVWLGWEFLSVIQDADTNVKAGIFGSLGAFLIAIWTNYYSRQREVLARHFSDKRESYEELIDLLVSVMQSTKQERPIQQDVLLEKMYKFKKSLMVWGSPEVIQEWIRFEMDSGDESRTPLEMIQSTERVLKAMRKDLGHNDRKLKSGYLIGLFITDREKILSSK